MYASLSVRIATVLHPAVAWMGEGDRLALAIVTLIAVAATIVVYPAENIPLIDDWAYAWSVEHLLDTGELRILDWSINYPLAQIIWGALFTHAFGFSFFILRVSTLTLGWLGLVAFFFTLRALGIDAFWSSLGTLALLFNPVLFVLGHSFMTDVPFVSAMNLAVLCYVLWVQRRSSIPLGLGSVFATVCFLTRWVGAAVPLVPLAYLLLSRILGGEWRALRWHEVLFLVFPFLGIGLTMGWIQYVHGATSEYLQRTEALDYLFSTAWWLPSSWWVYFRGMVDALTHLGVVLSPLALASLWGRSKRLLLLSSVLVALMTGLYLWQFGEMPNPLEYGQTLSLEELGASRPLISGELMNQPMSAWTVWGLLALSLASGSAIIAALVEAVWRGSRWMSQPRTVIATNGLLQFSAIEILWLYYDRYYLPLIPGLIALLVSGMKRTRIVEAAVGVGVLTFAAISVSGTVDNFRFNTAVSNAREWLLSEGVAAGQIDAGYVLNGWWLYAHPVNLPAGARPESDVPFVTSSTNLPHTIANSPVPCYRTVSVFTWWSLWAASDRIYVLERMEDAGRC